MLLEISYLNILLLSIVALFIIYRKWQLKHQRFYYLANKFEKINYPKFPLLGNAHLLLEGLSGIIKLCTELKDLSKPTAFWLGPKLFVGLNRPDHLEIAFFSNMAINKPKEFKMFCAVTQGGLIFTEAPKWKKDRKLMNVIFNQKILDSHVNIFTKHCENYTEKLSSYEGNQFDVSFSLMELFFDIFFETSVGVSGEKYRKQFLQNSEKAIRIVMMRIVNPLLHFDWIFNQTKNGKQLKKIEADLKQMVTEILDCKINEFTANAESRNQKFMFLDYLLNFLKDNIITKDQILSELTLFIIAAFDTCTSESSFMFLMLGMHPEIQEKLYEEVTRIAGLKQNSIDHKALSEMTYLDKVIKETMRLFPIGPFLLRTTTGELDLGGYIIPEGCVLAINVFGLHRLEKYYVNPLVFDPERFSAEEVAKRPRMSYLPFSAGPRNCIGQKFAMLSLKCLFANVIREFRIETPYKTLDSIKLEQSLSLKAIDGYPITLRKRN